MNNQKGSVLLLILGVLATISILIGGYIYWQNQKIDNEQIAQNVTPIPVTQNNGNAIPGKIAYIKNSELYLLDAQGNNKKLATVGTISDLKWSPNGKYIAWIYREDRKFNDGNNGYEYSQSYGVSINRYDLETSQVKEVVKSNLPEKIDSKELWNQTIVNFDFINEDGTKLAYTRGGLRLKDINAGTEEKIAENDWLLGNKDNSVSYFYGSVDWNISLGKLLVSKNFPHWHNLEYYDIDTKKSELVAQGVFYDHELTKDGKTIVTFGTSGLNAGGLWALSITDKKQRSLLPTAEGTLLDVVSAAISHDNKLMIAGGGLSDSEVKVLPKYGIYEVKWDGKHTLLKEVQNISDLQWAPNGNQISYLTSQGDYDPKEKNPNTYSLHIMNSNGTGETSLASNISSVYAWSSR